MTLRRLERDFDGLFERIEQAVISHTKEFTLTFVGNVTAFARVDTSQLISNFQVSVASKENDVIEAFVDGSLGSTAEASRSITVLEAEFELESKTRVGQDIYIVNNVDYLIEDVDIGTTFERSIIQTESSRRSFLNARL